MEIVRYRKGQLAGVTLVTALCAVLFIVLYLHPENAAKMRGARIFATSFGHNLLAPALIAACGYLAVRAATLAIGGAAAIEARRDALYVTSLTARHRIGWDELAAVGVQPHYGHDHIVFHIRSLAPFGTSARRLPLAQLDVDPTRIDDLFDRIERVRAGLAAPAAATAPAPPQPAAPARPAFGRKAV